RGFETPTINELSYRPDGQSGLNFALQPATNTTVEAGSKWQVGTGMASLSVFNTDTKNEIVVAASDNGRTSYQNAGKTRRRGVELGWDQQFA
ncbi:TonB-dependent receptor, partial [Escherichia coli]